jgi:hypothetical protein
MELDESVISNHSAEIRHVLGISPEPLTARQIYAQSKSFPNCDRVSRTLYNLSQSGAVETVDPAERPRRYKLANGSATPSVGKTERRRPQRKIKGPQGKQPVPVTPSIKDLLTEGRAPSVRRTIAHCEIALDLLPFILC